MIGAEIDHRGLIYADDERFLAVARPFLADAVERGEPALAIVGAPRERALRDLLGDAAADVEFHAPRDWYRTAARTLAGYATFLAERPGADRISAIGELPWDDRGRVAVREWARADAIVNAGFGDARVEMICAYRADLPAEILANARACHPTLYDGTERVANPDAVDMHAFLRGLDGEPLPEPPATRVAELAFDDDPAVARHFVAARAAREGLALDQIDVLRLVVSELATNAILHGRVPRAVRVWSEDHRIVCEVDDGGGGIDSPLAGFLVPDAEEIGGRGLWIARQLCEHVEIRGARVRFHVAVA